MAGVTLKSKSLASVRPTLPLDQVIEKEPSVRVNLEVPESVRLRWKQAALDRRQTVVQLVMEAMEKELTVKQ